MQGIKIVMEVVPLELHLEWIKDCFYPDGNHVYESYINTWATDSQWYNGGDSVEETAYAYRAHITAMKFGKGQVTLYQLKSTTERQKR